MLKSLIAAPAIGLALVIVTVASPRTLSAAVKEPASPAVLTSSASVTQLEQQLITLLQELVQLLTTQLHAAQQTPAKVVVPVPTPTPTPAPTATTTSQVACVAGYHECTGSNCLHAGLVLASPYSCITSTNPVSVTTIPAAAVWPSSSCYDLPPNQLTAITQSADYFGNPLPSECVPDDPISAL